MLSPCRECLAPLHRPMYVGPSQQQRGRGWAFYPGQVALPLGQSRHPAHSWLGEKKQMQMHCIIHIYPQVTEHCASCSTPALQSRSLLSFSTQETCSFVKAVEAYAVKVCGAIPGLGKDAWQHQCHPNPPCVLPSCRQEPGQGADDTSPCRAECGSHWELGFSTLILWGRAGSLAAGFSFGDGSVSKAAF